MLLPMSVKYIKWKVHAILIMRSQMDVFLFSTVSKLWLFKLIVVYGLVVLMHYQISLGAAVVVQPSFSPDGFVQDIHKYKSSVISLISGIKSLIYSLFHQFSLLFFIEYLPRNSISIIL